MLWDDLHDEESPTPSTSAQGTIWGTTPLTPWDFNQSLIHVENGQLPMLEPLLPFKNVLVDVGENKVPDVKVIKTQPLLFPTKMEGSPEGNNKPPHRKKRLSELLPLYLSNASRDLS